MSKQLETMEIRTLGERRGNPRLWIDGDQAMRGGFAPGVEFNPKVDKERCMLTLEVVTSGGERVVSKKIVRDREIPVIDINNSDLLGMFVKLGLTAVRIVVKYHRIFILPIASELRAMERLERLKAKLDAGEPLLIGSFSAGIGILDRAAHEGLEAACVASRLAVANEIRADCMAHAVERNPVYDAKTILLTAPMQEVVFDSWLMSQLPKLDGIVIGIPCSGASSAGRSKLKLTHPEDHPDVGHLVVPFLAAVAQTSPAFVVIECVPNWLKTASASISRSMLRDLGYVVHETVLNAADFNMLEHRQRMAMVAVTNPLSFDFDMVEVPVPQEHCFAEIMDDVPLDDKSWSRLDYLKEKEIRDKAANKGFSMTVIDGTATKLPTLNKTLAKRQSTGTFIQHPIDPDLLRIPTVAEHGRAKGIWTEMVDGTTQTFGHEVCGQAISVPPWIAVFKAIGKTLISFKESATLTFSSFVRPELKAA